MKTFLISCVAAIVIAVIGGVVLNSVQKQSDKAYTLPESVRIGA